MNGGTIEQNRSRFESHPKVRERAVEYLLRAAESANVLQFAAEQLSELLSDSGAETVAWVRGDRGRWTALSEAGRKQPLPESLLGEVLDEEAVRSRDRWTVAPVERPVARGEVLALRGLASETELAEVDAWAALWAACTTTVRDRERARRRIARLEAILEIAAQWRQTLEMDTLLMQMAEASTRLLDSERASIFLWDRPNKQLIGRPALGVEGNELRIPDDTGIVGQVVHSGEPRRVNADEDQGDIDRSVDKKLKFETRSLLCVPLRATSGELFGAFEMINKRNGNFTDGDEAALTELAAHAAIALENTQQYEDLLNKRNQMADQAAEGVRLIGDCPALDALRSTVRRVAGTDLAILILGENGTGKEVIAQMVHYLSGRRNEPFVAVNCAALTETLLESELFGHEKGAFTDAHESRAGKFELASGGTLFLDEIGDMSVGGQAKLLRVLEEKVVVRVGGSRPIHTDARVIAATNQNLAEMVRAKKFREDLYFRLNVVTLELPPLRERGEDILLLAEHFLKDFAAKARRRPPALTAEAKKRLLQHLWPGNVRELRNLMERLAYLSQGDKIQADELSFILSPGGQAPDAMPLGLALSDATRRFQADYIQKHIDQARGNMTEAARRLGLHRSNLYRKMRQLDMETGSEDE